MKHHLARIGAVAAIAGALGVLAGTILHPAGADPNDEVAAFTEYAADGLWVASHLLQFLGICSLGAALVALTRLVDTARARAWARIARMGVAASVAAGAALQAVDGVALKLAVDRWAAASGEAQARAFEAAVAVRQIEIGLASYLSVALGLTIGVVGVALLCSSLPRWLGWLGIVSGAATFAGGIAQAYTGFSGLAMMLSMAASVVVLVWVVAAGMLMWRLAPSFAVE